MQAHPPQRTLPITMLTSTFSHSSLLHLGVNMVGPLGLWHRCGAGEAPPCGCSACQGCREQASALICSLPVLTTCQVSSGCHKHAQDFGLRSQAVLSCVWLPQELGAEQFLAFYMISRHGGFDGASLPLHAITHKPRLLLGCYIDC